MTNSLNKYTIIYSVLWKLTERIGTQGIQFIMQVILARLLMPSDFGIVVLVMVFISISGVISQSGFNIALIQKREVDKEDLSSVFMLNIFLSIFLYIVLFLFAPLIGSFFNEDLLSSVLRILSISLFFNTVISIQNVVLTRNLQFKKIFFSSFFAVFISAFVGILLALKGYGIWSLVTQQLLSQLVLMFIYFFNVDWTPNLFVSKSRLKILFNFGWKLLVASLVDTIYNNSRNLIVGKTFDSSTLGYYNRGEQIPQLLVNNINGSIQSVILTALSANQDNKIIIKNMMRRSITTSAFFVFPLMIILVVIAKPLIELLLTEKWLLSAPFVQIFAMSYMLYPIHTTNLQAINAIGRSDIFLKLEIIKKSIGIFILIISLSYGIYAIAYGMLILAVISSFINSKPNEALFNYSFTEQIRDILPTLCIAIMTGLIVFPFKFIFTSNFSLIGVQIMFGTILYLIFAKIFKNESLYFILDLIKNKNRSN